MLIKKESTRVVGAVSADEDVPKSSRLPTSVFHLLDYQKSIRAILKIVAAEVDHVSQW